MGVIDTVKTLTYLPALLKLKKGMTPRPADVKDSFGARVEANAKNHPNASAIIFEGRQMNWSEFNALANRFANHMHAQGVQRGDVQAEEGDLIKAPAALSPSASEDQECGRRPL